MSHVERAEKFLDVPERAAWHDRALWFVREKRDRAAAQVPEWEALRELAQGIKQHTLSRLDHYLETFERNALAQGIHVHWAATAEDHNRIVGDILKKHDVRHVVKSKSMLTEECGLNPFLEQQGMEVTDTDLGEWIVQLRNEPPSHIVLPAIHTRKEEIADLFHEKLGTEAGNSDPDYLTAEARKHLRARFMQAQAGITGVNFAVAEEGCVVVCTNEGNADLGTVLPPLHIACMGIEKMVPRLQDLGVFTRLLARSATGQALTTYTSHFFGPRPQGEMHVVLVDNGRSAILGKEKFRSSLGCIRCGACLNTCPVYRRSGGHSYNNTIPGPIGAVLAPHQDSKRHASLPFASTLCGSCTSVCPVKIDLHEQLLAWRGELVEGGDVSPIKIKAAHVVAWILKSPFRYRTATRVMRSET